VFREWLSPAFRCLLRFSLSGMGRIKSHLTCSVNSAPQALVAAAILGQIRNLRDLAGFSKA
jgi:hypothetical protein